jgi:antitoxin ParD1/3/4
MTVSLSAPLKRYVEEKVSCGDYGSASEFLEEALREKREREVQDAHVVLAKKLQEGLEGGEGMEFSDEFAEASKIRLAKSLAGKNKRG